jgi:hypothetical protein
MTTSSEDLVRRDVAELWRDIPRFEGKYQVSNFGRVKSLAFVGGKGYTKRERILRQFKDSGYMRCTLGSAGKQLVHRLVMAAFVGPCPDGFNVSHRNGDPTDNRLVNLEYATPRFNTRLKEKHGTLLYGEAHPQAKLSWNDVCVIRSEKGRRSSKEMAREYGVSVSTIQRVISGARWKKQPNRRVNGE